MATPNGFLLQCVCAAVLFAEVGSVAAAGPSAEAVLPEGDAPPALVCGHFPDRVHAFVWRNWGAAEPARLAQILGVSVQEVAGMAEAMGLPADAPVSPEMERRGYATLIRRNWHLLPYGQLLELLDMTP